MNEKSTSSFSLQVMVNNMDCSLCILRDAQQQTFRKELIKGRSLIKWALRKIQLSSIECKHLKDVINNMKVCNIQQQNDINQLRDLATMMKKVIDIQHTNSTSDSRINDKYLDIWLQDVQKIYERLNLK